MQCIECCNPPCVFRGCATCKTCRDPAYRKGAECKAKPTADSNDWVRQHRPKNRLEREQWLCRICSSGLRCAACDERNPENFSQSMQRHRWDSSRSIHCKACCHPACSFPECYRPELAASIKQTYYADAGFVNVKRQRLGAHLTD